MQVHFQGRIYMADNLKGDENFQRKAQKVAEYIKDDDINVLFEKKYESEDGIYFPGRGSVKAQLDEGEYSAKILTKDGSVVPVKGKFEGLTYYSLSSDAVVDRVMTILRATNIIGMMADCFKLEGLPDSTK